MHIIYIDLYVYFAKNVFNLEKDYLQRLKAIFQFPFKIIPRNSLVSFVCFRNSFSPLY